MKIRLVTLALLAALLGAFIAAPIAAHAAPPPKSSPTIPVTGTLDDGGSFVGTVSDLAFSNVDGALTLDGVLNGTVTDALGNVTQITDLAFSALVTPAVDQACTILTLDIGPINLDLLGLVVDLAPVELDITAVPGAGNLLGNLLCAVASLLDNAGGPAAGLANLLNQILGLLG